MVSGSAMTRAIVSALRKEGASPQQVLTTWVSPLNPWEIPSRWGPKLAGVTPGLGMNFCDDSGRLVLETLNRGISIVRRHGFGDKAKLALNEVFTGHDHPLIFTASTPGNEAAAAFATEYALAIPDSCGALTFQGPSTFRRYKVHKDGFRPMGMIAAHHPGVTKEWMHRFLTEPRGQVERDTFDVYDRVRAWSESNLPPPKREGIIRCVTWLKLVNSAHLAYQLEQAVYNLGASSREPLPEFAELLFTHDAWLQIYNIWNNPDQSTAVNLVDLFDNIVPTYISERQFVKWFGARRSEKHFGQDNLERCTNGMEEFKAWFNDMEERVNARS